MVDHRAIQLIHAARTSTSLRREINRPAVSSSAHPLHARDAERRRRLTRALQLAVVAAVLTIALKAGAYLVTDSVGLLSDALESVVNLVAAVVALAVVQIATRPPDDDHPHGHDKADYFSAGLEGALILLAAGSIVIAAVPRLIDPAPLESVGIGLGVSLAATVLNLATGMFLIRTGRAEGSVVLEADGQHLLTDVWTSIGVVAGIVAVVVTGWHVLDPLIALVVAANIIATGLRLVRRSASGLMDAALEPEELTAIEVALADLSSDDVQFHALRTRRAGRRAFVSVHLLVPGHWTVQRGHDLAEVVEQRLRQVVGDGSSVLTHLEPLDDPLSHEDVDLDRPVERGAVTP
ncbi:MAG: cation transporter [Solirubrobacteraceae bacterium]|nr:cation transporter [Solirubrobacteraceae bacterium]